jgi:hypothetical protein
MFAACAAGAPAKPAAAPPKPAAPPAVETPALAAFVTAAAKMGVAYATPAGFVEVPVRANDDQSYDYAIASADRRIEMRFALRPYDLMPPVMRNRKMSFAFFMTGIINLARDGDVGKIPDGQSPPPSHYDADDVHLVPVRWPRGDPGPGAFGEGYQSAVAIFMHREVVGDAYTYVLLKDSAALDAMKEETFHALRFAKR